MKYKRETHNHRRLTTVMTMMMMLMVEVKVVVNTGTKEVDEGHLYNNVISRINLFLSEIV